MKKKYPFEPLIRHHLLIAILLAVWVFTFLYFTEPLDVNEFGNREKLIYLPLYAIIAALIYLIHLPIQYYIFKRNNKQWFIKDELLLNLIFIFTTIFVLRFFYLIVIVDWNPNAYRFWYHLKAIIIPAIFTILPIIIISRFAFGKYHEKKREDLKIEIKGEGNYEGLRLLLNELIIIKSADNYVEVYYKSGNKVKRTLIRNKLSLIDSEFEKLLRTHRSYLINPLHFQQWKTDNAKLSILMSYDIEVPVSKTYQKDIKMAIQLATN